MESNGYTIKGVKSITGREGLGYECTLYHNGIKVALVVDVADGGEANYYDVNDKEWDALKEYVKTLPPVTTKWGKEADQSFTCDVDIPIFVENLVNDFEFLKQMKRKCKTKTVFRLDDTPDDEVISINMPYDATMKAHLEQKYGKRLVEIVNETIAERIGAS